MKVKVHPKYLERVSDDQLAGRLSCPRQADCDCFDWCPFCEIDKGQVVLHCTGTKVVFERVQR